jgi:asparagine synthase (glutamine-hydrolysing)
MCGICGFIELKGQRGVRDEQVVARMASKLHHRGPDGSAIKQVFPVTFGFTRLSIIDLAGGMQPLTNEDDSLLLICNGEIFNYIELREAMVKKGHSFKTRTDVEVILHLYEEYGIEFVNMLNGQFAFALYDIRNQQVFLARDHFGILPLHYTVKNNTLIFGSEVKSILEHPYVDRAPDLTALDQVFTFPGLISPRSMFSGIHSLENGHYLQVDIPTGEVKNVEYWDLVYPEVGELDYSKPDHYYTDKLNELLDRSINLRLRSDVPVGCYLSGGLDSSLLATKLKQLTPETQRYTFSIDFADRGTSEGQYQRIVADQINSIHSEKLFLDADVVDLLRRTIYYCECPVKESYNTASFSLSRSVRDKNIKVILTGEGADELFGGYVGYKFDRLRAMMNGHTNGDGEVNPEKELRKKLWGNENFFYEKDYLKFAGEKKSIYSKSLGDRFEEFDCLNSFVVDSSKIKNRDIFHVRSYVDYKLRMVDHLLSDHGDRMAMANSVEARYPFLDVELASFAATIPPDLKLKDLQEKHVVRTIAEGLVPRQVLQREKFGFVAPPSTHILRQNNEYINDILSYDRIKRQGYFNPDKVEALKKEYSAEGFKLNIPFDNDLLITVLTFGVFLEQFQMD